MTEFHSWEKPTAREIDSACMSFRHDFGLMDQEQKDRLRWQAYEWLHAWRKELTNDRT